MGMSISQYISKSFFSFFSRVLTFLALTIYLYQLSYMELWDQDYLIGIYFLIILLLITVLIWLEPNDESSMVNPVWKEEVPFLFFLGTLTLILVFTRHSIISEISPWLDEFAQASSSSNSFAPRASAAEHQVPLDYLFTYWSEILFERNNFSLRFFASTFNVLACLGIFFFTYLRSGSGIISFVISIFFAFQFYIYKYGIEARPISIGLLCGILYFHRLYNFLYKENLNFGWRHYSGLFGHMLLFLFSIGLQPIFVLFSSALAILPLLFIKARQKEILITEGLFALSIIIFLPFEKLILEAGIPRVSKTITQMIPLFYENLKIRSIVKYGAVELPLLYYYLLSIIFLVIFGFAIYEFMKGYKHKNYLINFYSKNIFLIIWIIFPISFASAYLTVVDYPLFPRYVISGFLIYCLTLAIYLGLILEKIKKSKFSNALYISTVLIFTFVFTFHWAKLSPGTLNKAIAGSRRQDMTELFKYIFQNSTELDWLACVAPMDRGGCWDFSFISLGFSPSEPQKIRGKTQQRIDEAEILDWFVDKLMTKEEPRKLFLVVSHIWDEETMSLRSIEMDDMMEIRFFKGIMLIEINNKNRDFKKRLYKLFESMNSYSKKLDHSGRSQYLEILAALDIYIGNLDKAESRIEEFENILPDWRKNRVDKLKQIIQQKR